jgi:hypothetical protein
MASRQEPQQSPVVNVHVPPQPPAVRDTKVRLVLEVESEQLGWIILQIAERLSGSNDLHFEDEHHQV